MPLWCRRPMKIDVRLPEEGLWQNSFEFAGKGIQRCIISHELLYPIADWPDWKWKKWSWVRIIRQQRGNGEKERKKTSSSMETSREPNFLCFLDWIVLFFRPGFFFFLPRENFLVSTFLLVSCVSWPRKEDIASHMALTQPHRLQINGELNTR